MSELKKSISFTTYLLMTKLVCGKKGGLLLMFLSSVIGIHSKKLFSTSGDDEIDRVHSASKVNIYYSIS